MTSFPALLQLILQNNVSRSLFEKINLFPANLSSFKTLNNGIKGVTRRRMSYTTPEPLLLWRPKHQDYQLITIMIVTQHRGIPHAVVYLSGTTPDPPFIAAGYQEPGFAFFPFRQLLEHPLPDPVYTDSFGSPHVKTRSLFRVL